MILSDLTKNQNSNFLKTIKTYQNLLAIMAHDLNGSLHTILMMSSDAFDAEEHLEFIPSIHKSALYSESIVSSVVSLIQIGADTPASHIESIKLFNVIETIVDTQLKQEAIQPSITYDLNQEQEIRFIKPFLQSIFQNLIQNAIKYRSAKRDLQIGISAKIEDNYLLVSIKDNGIGIDLKKHGDLLQKPFQQINVNKTGFGIGLYLVYSMMEIAEGKISVESEVDRGTTFLLYFPL